MHDGSHAPRVAQVFNAARNITQWRSSARAPVFLGRIGTYFTDFTDVALPPSVPIKKAHQAACVLKSLYPPLLFAITPRHTRLTGYVLKRIPYAWIYDDFAYSCH